MPCTVDKKNNYMPYSGKSYSDDGTELIYRITYESLIALHEYWQPIEEKPKYPNIIYRVNNDFEVVEIKCGGCNVQGARLFSTEKLAKEYIDKNKPKFSKNDLWNVVNNIISVAEIGGYSELIGKLYKYINSK